MTRASKNKNKDKKKWKFKTFFYVLIGKKLNESLIGKYVAKFWHLPSSISTLKVSQYIYIVNFSKNMANAKKFIKFEHDKILELP